MKITRVPIAKIYVPAGKRTEHPEDEIAALAEDILENGHTTPIMVRVGKDRYVLQSGLKRMMAMSLLGETMINAHIVQARKH